MKFFLIILLCSGWLTAESQDFSEYQYGVYNGKDAALFYRILYPAQFDSTKKYPIIVFLHGAMEKGNDNESQLRIGGAYFLKEENRKNFPAIILFPQCRERVVWADFDTDIDPATQQPARWRFPFNKNPSEPIRLLKALVDSLGTKTFVDTKRIYLGGMSQGGMGVFDMAARYPGLFAAAFPICGAGLTTTAKFFAGKVSMWIFHGEKDNVVPARFSRDYNNRLQKLSSDVKYTEYPGVYHDCWNNVFAERELMSWLFSKSKK